MEDRSASRPSLAAVAFTFAGVALLAGLVFAVPALHDAVVAAIHGDTAEVRNQLNSLGIAGPLLIIALALLHAIVFYPAEIVDAAAGFAYGFLPALALTMTAWLLSAMLCYAVGRSLARPLLDRWLGASASNAPRRRSSAAAPTLLIAVRLIPIFPFSLMCYAAGAARVPVWRYLWTTAVGYLPITAISVYFGTRLEGLSLTDPVVLATAAVLLALLLGGHWVVRRGAAETEEQ